MLEIRQLHKQFKQKIVANQLDLNVGAGSLMAILGASGSGKSTLLNMIAGLQTPDAGDIFLNAVRLNDVPVQRRNVAMMFQDFALLPHWNVWQNVAFGLRMRGVNKTQARQQAYDFLQQVGLADAAERQIDALSGGEKQRVALARALVGKPQVLLLDEPFSSLDTALRGQLQQLVVDLVHEHQIPALLVTHDPSEAALMADAMAILHEGRVIQQGTPANLFAQPVSVQAAKLLSCVNVDNARYVPPESIVLHHARGVECAVLSCVRQPALWRMVVAHPYWGELICWHDEAVIHTCRVWVDETRVVHFA